MLDYNTLNSIVEKDLINGEIEETILDKVDEIYAKKTDIPEQQKNYIVHMQLANTLTRIISIDMILPFKPTSVSDIYNYFITKINALPDNNSKYYYRYIITGNVKAQGSINQTNALFISGGYVYPGASRSGFTINTASYAEWNSDNNTIDYRGNNTTITDLEFQDSSLWIFYVFEI